MLLRVTKILLEMPMAEIYSFGYCVLRGRKTLEGTTLATCVLLDMRQTRTQKKVWSERARNGILVLLYS